MKLAASFESPELIAGYQKAYNIANEEFGPKVMTEIERIANEKRKQVIQNRDDFQKSNAKSAFFNTIEPNRDLISLDFVYTDEYWKRFGAYEVVLKNFSS